jgi:manganese oxidase
MRNSRRFSIILILALVLSLWASSSAAPVQSVKAAGKTIVYNLYATDGWQTLADGESIYRYGYVGGRQGEPLTIAKSAKGDDSGRNLYLPGGSPSPTPGAITAAEAQLAGNAQFPGPVIYAAVGDVVEIHFKNLGVTERTAPNDPHSIHLHGLDVDAANDGVPETSIAAVPAPAPGEASVNGEGNVVVYMFSPKIAGTYIYHCHQEADIHVEMGMYGALIIYNPDDPAAQTGPGTGKGGTLYGWHYDRDYVMLLSEADPRQSISEDESADPPFNPTDYHPDYWFINGLNFPNTIHVGLNWNDWISAHPNYDPFIVGSISLQHADTNITDGEKVLIRMINIGFETQPMHMHGFHGKVIGSDARGWTWANDPATDPFGQGLEKNTITIGSGETYDWLIDMGQQSLAGMYSPNTQTRFTTSGPSSNTNGSAAGIPLPDESASYVTGPVVTGAAGLPTTGQLFPFHNHDDYKATNNGSYPGGMFTMIMTLP